MEQFDVHGRGLRVTVMESPATALLECLSCIMHHVLAFMLVRPDHHRWQKKKSAQPC